MSNGHRGQAFDDFLKEEGTFDEVSEIASRRVIAYKLEQARIEQHVTKSEMARRMNTSRSQLDRLLNADEPGIQLETLERGAHALGLRLKVDLA